MCSWRAPGRWARTHARALAASPPAQAKVGIIWRRPSSNIAWSENTRMSAKTSTGKRLAFELVFSVSIPLVPFSTCTGSMFDEDRRASACTLLRSRLGGCGRAEENAATATHHVAGPRGQPRRHERHRPYAYGLLDQRHLVRLQRRPSVVRERVQAKDGVGL